MLQQLSSSGQGGGESNHPRTGGFVKAHPRRRESRKAPVDALAVLSGALSGRWNRFVRETARARRRPTEPALHDLRVAMRRLLAVMTVVEGIPPGGHFRRPSRQLRRHLKAFNRLRDVHVELLAVRNLRRRYPILARYGAFLRREERVLGRVVRAEIRAIRQDTMVRSIADVQGVLANLYRSPAGPRAVGMMMRGSAATAFGRVLARRAALSPLEVRSIHRMRIAFKKFRYTVELNRPFFPWADRNHAKAMDEYQTAMGEIQDLEVFVAGLRRFIRREPRSVAPRLLPLFQFLSSARTEKVNAFLRSADRLETFWR